MEILALAIALILGIVIGTITGLAPGLHSNLVAVFLLALSAHPSFQIFTPLTLATCIVATAITQTIIDFIPSIYLGAPSEDTVLSVLPGHALLKEGKAHEALISAVAGTIFGITIGLLLVWPLIKIAPFVQTYITKAIPFALIALVIYMIAREEKPLPALIITLAAGFLGYLSLHVPVREPLLPLLTGLFGTPGLIASLKEINPLPKQTLSTMKESLPEKSEINKTALSTILVAPLCTLLPAIGSGYASLIAAEINDYSRKGFLFLNGAMNMLAMLWSFPLIYAIQKARTGAAATVSDLLQGIQTNEIIFLMLVALIVVCISFPLALFLSNKCASLITKINYQKLSTTILLLVTLLVFLMSRSLGLIILITATTLGIYALQSKVKRTHLMACLIIPSILYYLA